MKDYEFAILAGLPVNPAAQKRLGLKFAEPPPRSLKFPCHLCGQDTWMGPRQQVMLKTDATARATCFNCSVTIMRNNTNQADIKHLGGNSGDYVMKDGQSLQPQNN